MKGIHIESDAFFLCTSLVQHAGGAFTAVEIVNAGEATLPQVAPPLQLVAFFNSEKKLDVTVNIVFVAPDGSTFASQKTVLQFGDDPVVRSVVLISLQTLSEGKLLDQYGVYRIEARTEEATMVAATYLELLKP